MGKSLVDTNGAKEKACKYYESYLELGSVHKVGGFFGVSHSVVHRHFKILAHAVNSKQLFARCQPSQIGFYAGAKMV